MVEKALEGWLNVTQCRASFGRCEQTNAVISDLKIANSVREGPLYGAVVRFGTDIEVQIACVALSGVSRE